MDGNPVPRRLVSVLPRLASLPDEDAIDLVCDVFEQDWRAGARPAAESYLDSLPDLPRTPLLKELLPLEMYFRREAGEADSAEAYLARFPQDEETVRGAWETQGAGRDTDDDEPLPRVAPEGYEILELLGQGAFGVVYKARDLRLDRLVAIKFARRSFSTAAERERFRREGQSVAKLSHPGIASVYDVGDDGGGPFIVSEFVEGPDLKDYLKSQAFTPEAAARLVALLADAAEHAHGQQVIHRDLKPSNVLLADASDSATLTPRIVDFGLARLSDTETLTASGELLGSPAYMSPEQALGEGHRADARSDVYSLGVILYECLAGRAPFRGSVHEVIHAVSQTEPVPLRKRASQVPRDLAVICHKCLAKDPQQRYAVCHLLALDLRRFLRGEPIEARPVSQSMRLWRRIKRHPVPSGVVAVSLLLVLSGLSFGIWSHRQGIRQRIAQDLQYWLDLPSAEVAQVPDTLLDAAHQDYLREQLATKADVWSARQRMRAQIALLRQDASQQEPLIAYLLNDCDSAEAPFILTELLKLPRGREVLETTLVRSEGDSLRASWVGLRANLGDRAPPKLAKHFVAKALSLSEPQERLGWFAALEEDDLSLLHSELKEIVGGEEYPPGTRGVAAQTLAGQWVGNEGDLVSLLPTVADAHLVYFLEAGARSRGRLIGPARKEFQKRVRDAEKLGQECEENSPEVERGWHDAAVLGLFLNRLGDNACVSREMGRLTDPRLGAYLAHLRQVVNYATGTLLAELRATKAADQRCALIQSLGQLPRKAFTDAEYAGFLEVVKDRLQNDPDSGVHSVCVWALRTCGEGAFLRDRYEEWTRRATGEYRDGFRWRVNILGQCMIAIDLPDDPGIPQQLIDPQVPLTGYRFELAAQEMTWAQFRKHMPDLKPLMSFSIAEGDPVRGLRMLDELRFCQLLTEKEFEGRESQSVMTVEEGYDISLTKGGYRMPTSLEWLYAARAGTSTSAYFGTVAAPYVMDYVRDYRPLPQPPGMLLPNRWGFFDLLDNVTEPTIDFSGSRPAPDNPSIDSLRAGSRQVRPAYYFQTRGGSYRSSLRARIYHLQLRTKAQQPFEDVGFRLARTITD